MKQKKLLVICLVLFTGLFKPQSFAQQNHKHSPEAKALLNLFYNITGKYTLTGQHNYPNTKDRNTRFATRYIGKTPAIWSTDMGFADDGDTDSYLARPDIVKESIRQHKNGSLVTICWHAVPPTTNEPITFMPKQDADPNKLASVQGRLTEQQYKDLFTKGTDIYNKWLQQVDTIAVYLKKLQAAKVPILWRPYHEMNGDWFWWGGRVGENSTIDLYKQLYNRLVEFHKLDNLVWVWNVDRPSKPIRKFSNFYPGDEFLDIVSIDIYGNDFQKAYYDSLLVLAKSKPIFFGEVGNPPSLQILKEQPKWTSWVIWAGMARLTSQEQYEEYVKSKNVLFKESPDYWKIMSAYRETCGLPQLPLKQTCDINLTGKWLLNLKLSKFGKNSIGNTQSSMDIDQENDMLHLIKVIPVEWLDDRVSQEDFSIDGKPYFSQKRNTKIISTTNYDKTKRQITIYQEISNTHNNETRESKNREVWSLLKNGSLQIEQVSSDKQGENTNILIFEKK